MIIFRDEEYELWDAHSHWSRAFMPFFKFILKNYFLMEIMDIAFKEYKSFKKKAKNRIERSINLYNLVLDSFHIDRTIHLPVFKLDRETSYQMNELLPNKIFGFGYISPKSKELDQDLDQLKVYDVLGTKLHPDFGGFTFKDYQEELIKIFQFCADNKIIILSHTGSHSEVKNLIPILKKCDDSVLIMGHSGLCPQINQAIRVAKECPNSYMEISGNPYTYKFMEAINDPDIGVERILFGTDIPSLHPRVEIEKILALDISVDEKRLIFSKNLERLMKTFLGDKFKR